MSDAQRPPQGRPQGGPQRGPTPDATRDAYEHGADHWLDRRHPLDDDLARARALAVAVEDAGRPGPLLDLGCGPGWHLGALGSRAVGLDVAEAMARLAADRTEEPVAVCDARALPVARRSAAGAWACRSLVHLPRTGLPAALAELHGALAVGAPVDLTLFGGDLDHARLLDDDVAGRRFSAWDRRLLAAVVEGAGFSVVRVTPGRRRGPPRGSPDEPGRLVGPLVVTARRAVSLPDVVGPGMRLLVCGLNPSLHAADTGVPYSRPGNRFWAAARLAGLTSVDRRPWEALHADGLGFTDQVKRATSAASALRPGEQRRGRRRLAHLVAWLEPAAVCVVGLAGWRRAVDPGAVPGVQPLRLGGRPVVLVPSTSGRNARVGLDELAAGLAEAADVADRAADELVSDEERDGPPGGGRTSDAGRRPRAAG